MKIKLIIILSCLITVFLYFVLKENKKEELDFTKAIGYRSDYRIRYNNYQKSTNLDIQNTVTRVNIGIDFPFYTNTKEVNENGYVTLINKYLKLNRNYKPNDLEIVKVNNPNKLYLRKEAGESFERMTIDAMKENLHIILESAYRSYSYQVYLYNRYKDKDGIEKADTYSARPGYSEHQLGLSLDLRTKEYSYENFEKSKEFTWMSDNAYKYGFILRYTKNKEDITGYNYEPWHYRYVGLNIAKDMKNKNLSFDEYYYLYINKK